MDLQSHDEERDIQLQKWLEDVSVITSERVNRGVEGDYLTQWDEDSYNVVHYIDGRIEKTLISSTRPSVMLKHIEKVFNDWSLDLNIRAMETLTKSQKRAFNNRLIFGDSWITIYMNDFHRDMISDDSFGSWYVYADEFLIVSGGLVKLEDWIANHILKEAKKYPSDVQLQRIIKLKSLLKNGS